jgi:hypothetical protein
MCPLMSCWSGGQLPENWETVPLREFPVWTQVTKTASDPWATIQLLGGGFEEQPARAIPASAKTIQRLVPTVRA